MDHPELFHLRWKGRPLGPFSREVIQEKLRIGELSLLHEIKQGDQWTTLRTFLPPVESRPAVESLISSPPRTSASAPANGDGDESAATRVGRPTLRLRLPETAPESESEQPVILEAPARLPATPSIAPVEMVLAGFWRRFAADLLDGLLLLTVNGFLSLMVLGTLALLFSHRLDEVSRILLLTTLPLILMVIVDWLYAACMECSQCRGTLGKLAVGIAVTDLNGSRLSFGRASVRHFGKLVSTVAFMVGFMMAGVTKKKQALHDLLANCLVIVKQ